MTPDQLPLKNLAGLTQDSRKVQQGFLFAALKGVHSNGVEYIENAIQNGANYILSDQDVEPIHQQGVEHLRVSNPALIFAQMVAKFYAPQPQTVVAVTGTNGKSSVVDFTAQIWAALGFASGAMGTLGLQSESLTLDGNMTTPDPERLHEALQKASHAGVTHLAMEASSHGLHQYRMHGVALKAAGFTNLSHDHLDYHGDMEAYFQAKARLFSELLPKGCAAVLNADDPHFQDLKHICEERGIVILDYGREAKCLNIQEIKAQATGQSVKLRIFDQSYEFETNLIGAFQICNLLCAAGLVLAEGTVLARDVMRVMADVSGVRGRLEAVRGHPEKAGVYIDYAHTPDALEKVLTALRDHAVGRLICVFGCGGDRDKDKRPEMGKIAAAHADVVIVTDDNPRSEDPGSIRAEILQSAAKALDIADRATAIQTAINTAKAGDVVLIAGKGHEQGQILADRTIDFDDVTAAQRAIQNYKSEQQKEGEGT